MSTAAHSCATRHAFAALGSGVLFIYSNSAGAASSASYTISGDAFGVAGGVSASTSFRVTACVGSEIAGTQTSASFRIDSGCGSVQALALNDPTVQEAALPVPSLGVGGVVLLALFVVGLALWNRQRFRQPVG